MTAIAVPAAEVPFGSAAARAAASAGARVRAHARAEARVLRELVLREVRLQYRGTALGLAWSVASPLATAAVYVVLFRDVLGTAGHGYARELLAGLIPWTGFTAALCAAAHAPRTHAALLRGHRVAVHTLVA